MNESWRLCREADVLYGCDGAWWKKSKGVPEFSGLKISQDTDVCRDFDIHHVRLKEKEDTLLFADPAVIGDGGNSGFQAINLAVQFGVRRIVLVGFDMRLDRGPHWHGRHGKGLNNPSEANVIRWRRSIDGAAQVLADLGIEVINTSSISTLTAYPIRSLQEIFGC